MRQLSAAAAAAAGSDKSDEDISEADSESD